MGDTMIAIDLCVGWARVGEATGGAFTAVARDLAAGEWHLTGDVTGISLQGAYTLSDIDTIRVVDGKRIVFAGYVAPVASGAGGLEIVSTGTGPRYTLAGPDLWAVLASRLTYPSPSTEPPWPASFDERTGVASTVAAAYLYNNLGAGALAARRLTGVAIVDRSAGSTGAWAGRLQPLDELVQRICREGGITCRLSAGFDGALRVELVAARDRQSTTVVADTGDLVNIRRRRLGAAATFIVGGGQGALNARTFRTAGVATGAARIERFTDQTSLSTAIELQQATNVALAANAAMWSISAELSTEAAQTLAYGTDYDLGDTVAVQIDNVRYPVPVTAVTFDIAPDRQVIRPILGDAAPNLLAGLIRDVANLQARFDTNIA